MKVLIKDFDQILNLDISVYQRGLIFTALIVRESNSKITLAKFKALVNMREAKLPLIDLHEKGVINWSGYNAAKKSIEKKEINPDVVEAVNFMNNLYKRRFDCKSDSTTQSLKARLKEYDLDTIKGVIANRWERWSDDPVMKSHLNPTIDNQGYIQLNPELGDVIIFDQRATHKGTETQVQYPRLLVAFGFGKNNIFTDNFEKATIIRQNKQNNTAT